MATQVGDPVLCGVGEVALGAGAPLIKQKVISGTTNAAENGTGSAAHGLTTPTLLALDVAVDVGSNTFYTIGQTTTGNQFDAYIDGTNVNVHNHASNSENVLSKPFTALITYQ